MKTMRIVKALGFALALAGVAAPSLMASTALSFAREGGGTGGAGGGGGGSGNGGDTGEADGFRVRPGPSPNRLPPRIPRVPGRFVRDFDKNAPECFKYQIGMYSYYGYRIPLRCQPYLRPAAFE
jgi:hypothetical protein